MSERTQLEEMVAAARRSRITSQFLERFFSTLKLFGGTEETVERATTDEGLLSSVAKMLVGNIWKFTEHPFQLTLPSEKRVVHAQFGKRSRELERILDLHEFVPDGTNEYMLVHTSQKPSENQAVASIFELDAFAQIFTGNSHCKVIGSSLNIVGMMGGGNYAPVLHLHDPKTVTAENDQGLQSPEIFRLVRLLAA